MESEEKTDIKKKNFLVRIAESGYGIIVLIGLILIIVTAVVAIVSFVISKKNPDLCVFANILNNINIMFISTIATLIGLYVTAFIFLNDSLKARVKEDATIGDAVNSILLQYRWNMLAIAIVSIFAIVSEVVLNIVLDDHSVESAEKVKIALSDPRWYVFLLLTCVSIFVIIWIILCSRDITNSDGLIFKNSLRNRDSQRSEIIAAYRKIEEEANEVRSQHVDIKIEDSLHDGLLAEEGGKILNRFADMDYNLYDAYNKALKDGDIIGKRLNRENKVIAYSVNIRENYGKYEIELGKIVRLLENMVGRISDNNIDKSIMNNDYKNESIKNGFMWLYAQYKSNSAQNSEDMRYYGKDNLIDVRDSKRFLDHIKYQIITDATFENRPFNNSEVEKVFDCVVMAFENRQFKGEGTTTGKGKRDLINRYKNNTSKIIEQFFDGYKLVIGYRDAMVHLMRFKDRKRDKRTDEHIVDVINYATVLKRVLLDRFMSFVRTDELSLGNSTMDKGWFNYSELSESNFTHSSFKYACMENAILRHCDLSTCSFVLADASNTDFEDSNFSYSDLTGIDLSEAKLNRAQLNSVILRDQRIDSYYLGIEHLINSAIATDDGKYLLEKFSDIVNYDMLNELKERNNARRDWMEAFSKAQFDKLSEKEQLVNDKNELMRDALLKLREGKILKDLGKQMVQGIIGDISEELLFLDKKNVEDVNILIYDESGEPTGKSVISESYAAIKRYLAEYIGYRQHSKINRDLYNKFDIIRRIEYLVKDSNGWRKDKRESDYGKVYFRVAELKFASIKNVTMPNIDFSYVDMSSASFDNSDISSADMYNSNAEAVMFGNANLGMLDAYRANFDNANFNNANLIGANFVDCSLNGVNFKKALMLNSIFIKSDEARKAEAAAGLGEDIPEYLVRILKDKKLNRIGTGYAQRLMADIEGAKMVSHIKNLDKQSSFTAFDSDFSGALASHIIIMNLNMMRSKFIQTDMMSALLYNDVMIYGDMTETDLTNALMIGCSFHQADCKRINLQKALIYACEFSNANLSEASFNAAITARSNFDQTNLSEVNFSRSKVNNCSFVKCNFDRVNIADTRFTNCIFCDMDFSSAIGLDEAEFINCAFQKDNMVFSDPLLTISDKAKPTIVVLQAQEKADNSIAMNAVQRYTKTNKMQD